jgi:hypothetical protein
MIYNDGVEVVLGQQKILKRGWAGIQLETVDPNIKRYKEKLKELKADKSLEYNTLPGFLNFLGLEGWELVGSAPHLKPGGDSYPFLFMKRPTETTN